MRHITEIPKIELQKIKFLLTDVDDTITTEGKLHSQTLKVLWSLHESGITIIPVTGGSAGWADTYIRQWPIDAVITESGALAYYTEVDQRRGTFYHPSIEKEGYTLKAERLVNRVLQEVPGSKLSSDQFCRVFDIAFDHHSEPPYLEKEKIDSIIKICEEEGASYGVSSIHVNCWFGTYDKLDMVKLFMESYYHISLEELRNCGVYCGDSSNDIPLFQTFPLSVGVGDLFSADWDENDLPSYGSHEIGGKGFCEFAELLISAKRGIQS